MSTTNLHFLAFIFPDGFHLKNLTDKNKNPASSTSEKRKRDLYSISQ